MSDFTISERVKSLNFKIKFTNQYLIRFSKNSNLKSVALAVALSVVH